MNFPRTHSRCKRELPPVIVAVVLRTLMSPLRIWFLYAQDLGDDILRSALEGRAELSCDMTLPVHEIDVDFWFAGGQ
jgi:hypothetical protein